MLHLCCCQLNTSTFLLFALSWPFCSSAPKSCSSFLHLSACASEGEASGRQQTHPQLTTCALAFSLPWELGIPAKLSCDVCARTEGVERHAVNIQLGRCRLRHLMRTWPMPPSSWIRESHPSDQALRKKQQPRLFPTYPNPCDANHVDKPLAPVIAEQIREYRAASNATALFLSCPLSLVNLTASK